MSMNASPDDAAQAAPAAHAAIGLPDDAATAALGAALAEGVRALVLEGKLGSQGGGLTVYLSGDLGAGKTTLIRALLRALGVTGRIKSPTYTLVEPYLLEFCGKSATNRVELKENLSLYSYHFDFYRFTDPREWLEAGFREHFNDNSLCLVEWPEKARTAAGDLLPPPDLHIHLDFSGDGRHARLLAYSAKGAACLLSAIPSAGVSTAATSSPPR